MEIYYKFLEVFGIIRCAFRYLPQLFIQLVVDGGHQVPRLVRRGNT